MGMKSVASCRSRQPNSCVDGIAAAAAGGGKRAKGNCSIGGLSCLCLSPCSVRKGREVV